MAGGGTALTVGFNDFVEATGPTYVTGAHDLINDAQLRTYSFRHLTYGDTGNKKMLQGGSEIREKIIFKDNDSFRYTLPGQFRNWDHPQHLQKTRAFWRFSEAYMVWTRQEILLNEQMRFSQGDDLFQAYVNLRDQIEMRMWTSKWNGIERQVWAQPVVENMEAEGGREPYSIPAFVNEFTNGLFDPQAAAETVWTTVENLDPTNTAENIDEFVPQQRTYSVEINSQDDITNVGGLISTFDMMWMDTRFEQPPSLQEYFENPAFNRFGIYTSRAGHTAYKTALRVSQDRFVVAGGQDPSYNNPMYYGIPVIWVDELQTATLYANSAGTDTVAEGTANSIGPRYYWINSQYLYPVFHDQMYFEKDEVSRHHNDPDTFVCPVTTWYNVICTSRRHQGIVSPSGDLYTSLY